MIGNSIAGFLGTGVAVSASSYESIATVTAAGGEASLSFTSIVGTYKHLQIRGLSKDGSNASNNSLSNTINFNGDTGLNYTFHRLVGNGSSASAGGFANRTIITVESSSIGSLTSGLFAVSIVDILDYSSTTKYKTVRVLAGNDSNGVATNNIAMSSGVWMNTNAITTILISAAGGTFSAGSTFALYGIKG